MSPGNVEEFRAGEQGEAVYRPLVERLGQATVASVEAGGLPVLDKYDLSASDLRQLHHRADSDRDELAARTRAAELAGVDGRVDDCLALLRPWGFDHATINGPLAIWSGTDDVLVPRGHADWLATTLPHAQVQLMPGGHLIGSDRWQRILTYVRAPHR